MSQVVLLLSILLVAANAAKILFVVPTPSISHQVPFQPIIMELVKRGHEVTSLTTDAIFPNGGAPANLTEINLHDISYNAWKEIIFAEDFITLSSNRLLSQVKIILSGASQVFELQLQQPEVQNLLFNNTTKFDLLVIEEWVRSTFLFTHVFKDIPVIVGSSFGAVSRIFEKMGAPYRPFLLYPCIFRQKVVNMSLMDKITELYHRHILEGHFDNQDLEDDQMLKRILGPDTPTVKELENNVDLLLLNSHPLWDMNRPVPPSIVYMGGGIHLKPQKELPKELKQYLDSSKNGVIYISFGTNVSPSDLPAEKIQAMINAFSKLPYDILWKWNKDELPGKTENIRISKWLPQSDLLRHPNVKLFITQGGLQSTDEAITAGVPLIGMPMLGDQWFNVEHYVLHKVGVRVDIETLTEEQMLTTINTVINDNSYRKNMEKLRAVMHDQPQPALDKTVWWIEHLMRHGNGKHLRAPAANMSWAEYMDLELLGVIGAALLVAIAVVVIALQVLITTLRRVIRRRDENKKNN